MARCLEAAGREPDTDHALVLWDIAGFYEHVSPDTIEQAVLEEGLPLVATTLSLFGHAEARIIRWQSDFSNTIVPGRSLATGCHTSPSHARAILKKPITKSANDVEAWRTRKLQNGSKMSEVPAVKMNGEQLRASCKH